MQCQSLLSRLYLLAILASCLVLGQLESVLAQTSGLPPTVLNHFKSESQSLKGSKAGAASCRLLSQSNPIFDPELLLQSKGVDTNKIKFKFDFRPIHHYAGVIVAEYDSRPLIRIYFKDPYRARVAALTVFEGQSVFIGYDIDESGRKYPKFENKDAHFLGTGIGSTTYLIAAYLLYKRHKLILTSDGFTHISKSAQKVWRRFESLGFARAVGKADSLRYEFGFQNQSLKQIEIIEKFLADRLQAEPGPEKAK